jgi:hypothetical protein
VIEDSRIFCPECMEFYSLDQIIAVKQTDNSEDSWSRLMGDRTETVDQRRSPFRRSRTAARTVGLQATPQQVGAAQRRAKILSEGWTPKCPEKHLVSENLDPTIVIAIVGMRGAGKSSFMAGAIFELLHLGLANTLDASISPLPRTGLTGELKTRIESIYRDQKPLGATERGTVTGPFAYRVRAGAQVYNFFLYDVAGEDCVDLSASALTLKHAFFAQSLIFLLDPTAIGNHDIWSAEQRSADLFENVAAAIEYITHEQPKDRDQMVSVVIGKADLLDSFDLPKWPIQPVLNEGERESLGSRREVLWDFVLEQSIAARGVIRLEDPNLLSTIERLFPVTDQSYACVAATNETAFDERYVDAHPTNCALPIVRILMELGAI